MFRFGSALGKRRQRMESDLDAELRDHLERQVADYIASGMTPAEARRRARAHFGGAEQIKEECRQVRSWWRLEMIVRDLMHACRSLRRSPSFTVVAISLLAVGIGSNLAAFTLIDALLLRPLPIQDAQSVVQIASVDKDGQEQRLFSKIMEPLRREQVFRGMCAWDMPSRTTEINGLLRSMRVLAVTGDCFSSLGIRTQLGRPFTMHDDDMRAKRVAVLSDALWRGSFDSSPDVLGTTIKVGVDVFTVIGVAEPAFTGFTRGYPADVVIPLAQRPWPGGNVPSGPGPFYFWVAILGRLQPDVTLRHAQARLSAIERPLLEEHAPRNAEQRRDYVNGRIIVRSAEDALDTTRNGWVKGRFGGPLYAIWVICSLVLLVGCVNLAILFLGRGMARRREIAIRLALGASRASVVRLLALESAPLALAGTVLGTMLARLITHAVAVQAWDAFAMVLSPVGVGPELGVRGALFLVGVFAMVALMLAAVPLWQARRLANERELKERGRGIAGSSGRSQKVLLGVQVALALASVSGAGLFASSLRHLENHDLGIETRDVSVVTLAAAPGVTVTDRIVPYYRDLLRQLEALPGVISAVVADIEPFWTYGREEPVGTVEDRSRRDVRAERIIVTDLFFDTLGISILAGEGFRVPDPNTSGSDSEETAIVSQSLAERLGGEQLIGRHIRIGEPESARRLRVVGIAADARLHFPLEGEPLAVYINLWQHPDIWSPVILVKTQNGALLSAADLRRVLASWGQHYADDYRTLDQGKDRALIEDRLLADGSTALGALSLILAATGLFGLLSYQVASRTSEIGVRMALGAGRRQIHWHVLRQLLPVMLAGTAGGVGLTLLLGKLIAGLLYGVSVHDPRLLGLSVAVLMATAALAALIPARKAASVDPVVALRHE